jgi:hypothetical protein
MPGYSHILVTVDIEDPTNTERELYRAREIAERIVREAGVSVLVAR